MTIRDKRGPQRPQCRFCKAELHHIFLDLGMSPLCQSHIEPHQLGEMEPFFPLHVYVCEKCFLVQLPECVRPEQLFTEYAYFSSYSDSWLEHVRRYTTMIIERFGLNSRSQVIEIGSNDGYLLQYFVQRGIPVVGIEPAANVAREAKRRGIPTVVMFFDGQTARDLANKNWSADLIIGNNVLAHVPDVNDFVCGMKRLLRTQGIITMEFPHLMKLMEGNQFDTIYHEHFSYFSLITVEKICSAHGMTLFDVEEWPTHGGSLRIYVCHAEDQSKPITSRVERLRAQEEDAGFTRLGHYFSFAGRVRETKARLLEFLIRARRQGKSIAGYGAPGKGNTLLNYCGIRADFLDYTVDRNPYKQRKFTPGTHIPIHHPDKIRETKPDYVMILAWNLRDEIMSQLSYIREWGGKFIVPIPAVKVYS